MSLSRCVKVTVTVRLPEKVAGFFYLMVCYLACLISEAQPAGSLTITALLARMNSDVDGSACFRGFFGHSQCSEQQSVDEAGLWYSL